MKNNLFKKSMSVFLSVLMLMTCWVWVAPTEAAAADDTAEAITERNTAALNEINTNVSYDVSTTGNYYKFKIYGNGDDGGDNTTARQQKYYKNILSHDGDTALKGDNNRGSYFTNVTNSELTVSIAYPTMVLKYDGVTTPKFGIMLEADSTSGKTVRFERAWMDANSNGLSFNPNYWLGIANDDSAYFYCMDVADHKYTLRAQDTNQGGVFNARKNGQWEFLAASLEFTDSMSVGEWVRTISPTWKFYNGSTTYTGTNTSTIYVMNFKGYGELLSEINTQKSKILNEVDMYTYDSVRAFVDAAKNIINCNPKNYTAISSAPTWGSNMNTYYTAYTNAVKNLTNRTVDFRGENLFSFADWAASSSTAYTVDVGAGTVYITAGSNTNEVVTYHSGSSKRDTTKYAIPVEPNTAYTLEWTASSTQNADKVTSEMFAFFYDGNNNAFSTWANFSKQGNSNGTTKYSFTTPANTEYMEIRFDLNNQGYASNMTFSDVMLYKTSRAEEIGFADWTSGRNARQVFTAGGNLGETLPVPQRSGYTFDGWYDDTDKDGLKDTTEVYTDANGIVVSNLQSQKVNKSFSLKAAWVPATYTLTFDANGGTATNNSLTYGVDDNVTMPNATKNSYVFDFWKVITTDGNWNINDTYNANQVITDKYGNTTLQAQWSKLLEVKFVNYDGTVLKTEMVQSGKAATAPTGVDAPKKAADANSEYVFDKWDTDFSNVTTDITVKAVFKEKAHSFVYDVQENADCTHSALVTKRCTNEDCGYDFGDTPFYSDLEEHKALPHVYTKIVQNVKTETPDKTHYVDCLRCGDRITADHVFNLNANQSASDATCIKPGETYYICECLAEKTEYGSTNPNNHVNKEIRDAEAAKCEIDGYSGDTWCKDCNTKLEDGSVIPALEHVYTNYVYNNDAKCEIDGTETAVCDLCKVKTDTRTAENTALEHTFTKYTYNNDAKCGVDGTETAICDNCKVETATRTAAGTAREHDFTGAVKNNKNGTHSYDCKYNDCDVYGGTVACSEWKENTTAGKCECTACGYTKDHAWGNWQKNNDNTANAAGKMTRECADCKATEETDCTYTSTTTDATCTTDAYTTYTCTVCGHGYTVIDTGTATGHDFSDKEKIVSYNNGTHAYACANDDCSVEGVGETVGATEVCAYEYTNVAEKTHEAACDCGYNFTEDCAGGTATCTAKAICDKCKTDYGTTTSHIFDGEAVKLDGDYHAFRCTGCDATGVGTTENAKQKCSGGKATCSALAVCTVCGDTHGELNANAHKWGDWANVAGTETHKRICEYDEAHTETTGCEASGQAIVGADCETAGYTLNTCDFCNHTWKTNETSATDHKYPDTWTKVGNGTHTKTCVNDGCHYGENGAAKVISENCADAQPVVTPATCTDDGYTTYTCDDCGYVWVITDEGSANGHDFTAEIADEKYFKEAATCTTGTVYYLACEVCGESSKDETKIWTAADALDHDFTEKVADKAHQHTAADCTTDAVYYYDCSRCDEISTTDTWTDAGSQLGHEWANTETYVHTESDCITDAVFYQECSRCHISSEGETDETWTKENSKSGHKFESEESFTEYKDPDCTNAGNKAYYTCDLCKVKFSDKGITVIYQTEIPALGHEWKKVPYKAASCEEAGHSDYDDCSRCDAIKGKSDIAATGHDFTGAYVFDSAIGYHSRYCTNDNCLADGTKATGMKDAEGNNVKFEVSFNADDEIVVAGGEKCSFDSAEADTDANGIHSHKLVCVCGNITARAYSDEETFDETVAPTCTENGYDAHKCPDCDDAWVKNIVEAGGHDVAGEATSNGNGTHSVKCSKCDYSENAEKCYGGTATCMAEAVCTVCNTAYGKKADHTFDETKWVYQNDATCTENGTEKNTCTVENCGYEATREAKDTATGHSMIADYVFDISAWAHKPADFSEDIKAPTCKQEGLGIIYCVNCSCYKTKTVKADSSAHEWPEQWEKTGGDCLTGIVETRACTVCGTKQSRNVPSEDHTWKTIAVVAPTCEKEGYTERICTVCSTTEKVSGEAALDHDWVVTVIKEATCATTGRSEKSCARCGKVEEERLPKRIHVWDADGDGITDSTFNAEEYIASLNGATSQFIYIEAIAPSCDLPGYNAYYKCLDCSYDQHRDERWLAVAGNYVAATGHADNDADGKCDSCKETVYDGDKTCGCICHEENWLLKIIYKIFNFFWKLFRIKPTCKCGTVHY